MNAPTNPAIAALQDPPMTQEEIDKLAFLLDRFRVQAAKPNGEVNGRPDGSMYGRNMDLALATDARVMLCYYGAPARLLEETVGQLG